ncbi:MAG TPA: zinc-dependent metalloprotease [Ilumatobacteraceae bacterium]
MAGVPPNDDASDQPDDPRNPFAGLPMFGDLARALAGQGPLNWDAARQFAQLGATGGKAEHNVDPAVRLAYADLSRIAAMHVSDVTGAELAFPEPQIVTRGQWARDTLEAYRPLFTDLATSLASGATDDADEAETDPMMQMMSGLNRMMAPAMLGMAVGSMVGQLAQRVFGLHDLPIPRLRSEVVLVGGNIDEFAAAWEVPVDEMRLWVLAHELSGHVLFSVDHVRQPLADLVRRHAGGFRPDPRAIADRLSGLDITDDDPMQALQQAFADPEVLLGAVRSPEQLELAPALDAAVATVVGYTDWVVDAVAVRVIGGDALRIAEAVRRQRVEITPGDAFVEHLLGIRLGDDQVARGKAFAQGVVDRAGEHGLEPLLTTPGSLPTPAEVDAPGLWLARVTGD